MAFRVDVLSDDTAWAAVLAAMPAYDFVHTFDFHAVASSNGEGEPLLFAVFDLKANSYSVCWPLLKRDIPDSDRFDFSSVYGYGGPLIADESIAEECLNLIFAKMSHMGAVSLFSRMHPLFISLLSSPDLKGEKLADVVVIDSALDLNPPKLYRSAHRYEIRKALRLGVATFIDSRCEFIDDFLRIYHDSMRDLSASEYYFFDAGYFQCLLKSTDFKIFLIFAELDGKKIAASLFFVTGRIMQYYLSGTDRSFRQLAPSKVIVARAHEISVEMGVEKIVLGGGVGSKRDSLFDFKAGFSDLILPFHVFKKIIDKDAYSRLCADRGVDYSRISFFPAYRAR